ncbi:MAG: sugar transferase [Flavobacteriaceae bacterium]|nr:sugar transferase [Flavobacteriaceae bacterium]
MAKRLFDIIFSLFGGIIFAPILAVIAIIIKLDSKGSIFYRQRRVGKHNTEFKIYKFRTMHVNADKMGLLTLGDTDTRITKFGYVLRKYKLDELPQLINVFKGEMSFVGPRPEVRKYVNMYSKSDAEILNIKPGITDYASIKYRNEVELLKASDNPEKLYINEILPEKIRLNKIYIANHNIITDIKIIIKTFIAIIF